MARVYVSSTFSDLEDYRKEVSLALRRLGHEDVAMEYYVAEDIRPLDRCLRDVGSCDIYVGVFAWRYGYVPKEGNPEQRSITELEYRKALAAGKTCLIFVLSEKAPWPMTKIEIAAFEQITKLRQELLGSERHMVSIFENSDELARKVNEAVYKWENTSGMTGKRQPTNWDAYRQAVINKHQWVRLQVIAGASRSREPLRIPLTEVFEPQLIAVGASGTDVPDEVRKYQKSIYGPRQQAPEEAAPNVALETEISEEAGDEMTQESLLTANPELVLDILGRESTQVILGGPGSGKSTILQYAMLRVCQDGAVRDALPIHLQGTPIPFLIDLRNYVLQQEADFISYIVKRSKEFYAASVAAESVGNLLEQEGQALVFFDGLDEVFDPGERKHVVDQFETFARRYPGARIVVTSRIAGYDRTALGLAGFEHYTLLPLTLGQIRHFADQWYLYYTLEGTERTAQGLVQRIAENPRLLDLAGNPLLLTMMAVIYKDRDLPNERWRLYERCADTLLEDWDLVGKGIKGEDFKLTVLIRTAQKSEILQRVSMYMLEHGQSGRELNAIAYAPLLEIVSSYLVEKYQRSQGEAEAIAVDILRHLMERTYILAGTGERVFGFVHRTFMEYFAACRCLAQFNARRSDFTWLTRDIFGAHWQGGEWEEVLLLLIAMLHDQGTPVRDVVEYLRTEWRIASPFNDVFAARCLGEAGDVQDQVQAQSLLSILTQTITTYSQESRKGIAAAFVEPALGAFAALVPLVEVPTEVQDGIDRLNRIGTLATRMAAWQMGFALRSHKDRLDYALAALKDREEVVRRGAIAALEREWPGRADIGPVMAEVVRNDRNARVRQAALGAMQRSWRYEPRILDAIASRIHEETAYTYVMRLIEYLAVAWRGNLKALDLVLKLVGWKPKASSDYDYYSVVRTAGKAIAQGWNGDAQALTFLEDRAKNDRDAQIRSAGLGAIAQGWPKNAQAGAFLQDRVMNDPDAQTRSAGLEAIAHIWDGDAQVWAFLQDRAMNDLYAHTRSAVLRVIAHRWGHNAQVWAFLQDRARNDPDVETRAAVLYAIAQGWHTLLVAYLQARTRNDPNAQTYSAALEAIANGWHIEALAFLQDRATNDPDAGTRSTGLRAIAVGWFREKKALAFLQYRATNDPDPQTRSTALEAIAHGWPNKKQLLLFPQGRDTDDQDAKDLYA